MKILSLLVVLSIPVLSYTQDCEDIIDKSVVIRKAIIRHAYWAGSDVYKPKIILDKENCTWIVASAKTRHTEWGDCKYTNGCTVLKTATLVIDARTGKVISNEKTRSKSHNYE